jgi:hypothetical protein
MDKALTKDEFVIRWGCRTIPSHDFTDDKYEDKSKECLSDLNTLLRNELIKYELSFKDGEKAIGLVDDYLKSQQQ